MQQEVYTIYFNDLSLPYAFKKKIIDELGPPEKFLLNTSHIETINKNYSLKLEPPLRDDLNKYEDIIERCYKKEISILCYGKEDYPKLLRNIDDPPLILYKIGKDIKDSLSISVVGSRRASVYGCDFAYKIAGDLAGRGISIVSGLAKGVDAFAHKGCLSNQGHTIAVLGCGVDVIYPKSNYSLYREIAQRGTILSEYPLFSGPRKENFPRRNRIIAGLSQGTCVIEAPFKSGSRITARLSLEYNRDVFALPGRADSTLSDGSNDLIKRGHAKLITCSNDILLEYEHIMRSFNVKKCNNDENLKFSKDECRVLDSLAIGEKQHIDELANAMNLKYEKLLDIILSLELKGVLSREPGNNVLRGI